MKRRWILGGALTWVMAGIIFAKPGTLVTSDGKRYEGDISERNDQYVVNIHGVETAVNRADVVSLNYTEAADKEFASRMAGLKPDDVAGRIELARWAFDRRHYGLAREALDSALKIDPNNREATDLQNTISSQMKLEQNKSVAPDLPTPPPTANGIERRLLTANDISIIRQKELQPGDHVSVRFDNNVEKRFMKFRNVQFNDFNALKPVDKALRILDEGDDTMKADVKVLGDPGSIMDYRRLIQPIVLNGCAASNCHGGDKGGDFVLYNVVDNDAAAYTDLFILMRYKKVVGESASAGVFASPARKMVDRGAGNRSLLAEFGLPTDVSQIDHPQVMGYDFVFRNVADVKYKQVLDWMNKSLKQPEPDYSAIKYDTPRGATSRPVRPATMPAR